MSVWFHLVLVLFSLFLFFLCSLSFLVSMVSDLSCLFLFLLMTSLCLFKPLAFSVQCLPLLMLKCSCLVHFLLCILLVKKEKKKNLNLFLSCVCQTTREKSDISLKYKMMTFCLLCLFYPFQLVNMVTFVGGA